MNKVLVVTLWSRRSSGTDPASMAEVVGVALDDTTAAAMGERAVKAAMRRYHPPGRVLCSYKVDEHVPGEVWGIEAKTEAKQQPAAGNYTPGMEVDVFED